MPNKCLAFTASFCLLAAIGCHGPISKDRVLTVDLPLHLEEHVDAARIEGSEVPKDIPEVASWRFDRDQPPWKVIVPFTPPQKPLEVVRVKDALRLILTKKIETQAGKTLKREGGVYLDLPDWKRDDWDIIVIQARTTDVGYLSLAYNLRDKPGKTPAEQSRFLSHGEMVNVIKDGEVRTYLLRVNHGRTDDWKDPWKQLGIGVSSLDSGEADGSEGPKTIDILSVSVIPKAMNYAKARAGTRGEPWGKASRRALYTHVPGRIEYRVKIPETGRLDFGFGLLKTDAPVKFRVSVREGAAGAAAKTLLEETYSAEKPRPQHSVDLSRLAGKTIFLALETEAERTGNVAFWAAPTISGARSTEKPNIIFYVIDGASADSMSVYGYNRRTTPYLERLAAEGAVFENAYSNSTWTMVSVPSFMTSLQSSVMGGFKVGTDPLPEQAETMAQRMHKAGYQTEVLTSNPYCGRTSSLDRGVDSIVDTQPNYEKYEPPSFGLNQEFWRMREAYPGEPYWAHFQPTDIHFPWKPSAPYAGLFAGLEDRQAYQEMRKKMYGITGDSWDNIFKKAGIDPVRYIQVIRNFYDESMAYQDHMIGRLVERLKDRGEWEKTLFIVASDHGAKGAAVPFFDPNKPKYYAPLLAAHRSRIPMIFVWPGRIAPGQRLTQTVSMIDMLPTILDLAGLPSAEIAQGQSLAPLLLGKSGWTTRPVVLDEFNVRDNYFFGSVEVIDGRWGASLRIDPRPDDKKGPTERLRPAKLLLFDLWEDPEAFKSLHEARPDLVEKYSRMLDRIWKEHQALAKKFTKVGNAALAPEQIETLRSLGYLR